jgi:hypothetical protein
MEAQIIQRFQNSVSNIITEILAQEKGNGMDIVSKQLEECLQYIAKKDYPRR